MWKKYLLLTAATFVFCASAFTLRVAGEQAALASRLIRLHVVAASDTPEDQARKLAVRDALLPEIAALTAGCADASEAAAALEEGLPALADAARRTLGSGEGVTASLTRERFPQRDYETFSLPAGVYRALRIRLGAGQGHNWWCVAFPALCLPAAEPEADAFAETAEAAGFFPEELALMRSDAPNVTLKFRLLDWLSALFTD